MRGWQPPAPFPYSVSQFSPRRVWAVSAATRRCAHCEKTSVRSRRQDINSSMPMTIEAAMRAGVVPAKFMSVGRLPLGGLLAVVAIWFLGMGAAATLVQPDAVIGFGPPAKMIPAIVSSNGYLLDAGRFTVAAKTGQGTGQGT